MSKLLFLALLLASAAPLLASGEALEFTTKDGAVKVAFHVARTGWLATDITVTEGKSTRTIAKSDVNGFYNAHQKLLLYYATYVDERMATLDLEWNYETQQGTLIYQNTPEAGRDPAKRPVTLSMHGLK